MKFKKIHSILIFFLVILIFFSSAYYLFWQPDHLVNFVPDDSFLYLHLDLDNSRRIGSITNQWLNSQEIKNIFAEVFPRNDLLNSLFKEDVIKDLNEVALVGLKTRNDSSLKKEIVFLIQARRWVNKDKLAEKLQKFFVKEIDKRIYLISKNPIFFDNGEKKYLFDYKSISFSNFFHLPILKGNFIPNFWLDNFKEDSKVIKFKGFYPRSKRLEFYFYPIHFSQNTPEDIFWDLESLEKETEEGFVLIYPQVETIDLFKKKVREFLAWQNPSEEKRVLPDKTDFTELVVNPENFNFLLKKIKEKDVYYWTKKPDQKGFLKHLILWQDQNYFFISNNLDLSEDFITDFKKFDFLLEQGLQKGFYLDLNKQSIEGVSLIKSLTETKGFLILN